MKHKGNHTNTQFPGGLKFLLIISVVLVLCVMLVTGLFFMAARGPWPEFSKRLCATLAEKNSAFGGVFFTTSELEKALLYYAGDEVQGNANPGREYESCENGVSLSGDGWSGYIISVSSSSVLLNAGSSSGRSGVSLGLDADPAAVFIDGCLTYTGENNLDKYSFCGMDSSAVLHASSMTAVEAVNAGYVWGFSIERVLVSGGAPCPNLGGGYASRAAVGQCEDGTVLIFAARSKGLYPCGIGYDEMASVMYGYGAIRAVALTPAGEMSVNGKTVVSFGNKAGYLLTAELTVN